MNEIQRHSNPLFTQPEEPLHNIVNGRVAAAEVNVDQSLAIGEKMAAEYMATLPEGFYEPLKKRIVTMEAIKKKVKVGDTNVYDMEKLYARLLVISQNRDIELSELFKYELTPMPLSLFDEYGDLRKGSKHVLMQKLAVFTENELPPVEVQLIDGNEALYHTFWPKNTTLLHFAQGLVDRFVRPCETFVIFDCYKENSVKSHERQRRAKGIAPRAYELRSETILPSKENIMKSDQNKKSLIQFLCNMEHNHNSLHLIGEDSPYTHEEADVTIMSYLVKIHQEKEHIQILADDTDIFVLLLFFYWKYRPSAHVTMKKYNGQIIDIKATALKLGDKCLDLLAAHVLSGCDTVSYPFGKGKMTAINLLLKSNVTLHAFVDPLATEQEWVREGLHFMSYLYGGEASVSVSSLRFLLFSKKKEPPKIKCLPPTDDAALQHIRRARLQVLLWRAADQMEPPELDITQYGWKIQNNIPTPVSGVSAIAPRALLQCVACGCKSKSPCSTRGCSCRASKLSCTTYCRCCADDNCANENTKSAMAMDDHDDEDEEESINDDEV